MQNKRQVITKAFKCAFPHTIPIFAGFCFLGMTYGIYMNVSGFPFLVSHVNEPDYFRRQSGIFSSQYAACAICPGTGIYHGIDDPGTPSVLRNCHAGQV